MTIRTRRAMRRRVAGAVAALMLLPAVVAADLGSTIDETLARTQATVERLRAQLSSTLAGSLGQIQATLAASLARTQDTLSTLLLEAGNKYVVPTPGTVVEPSAYLDVGGSQRRYIVIRPATATPGAPVLILLHAHGVTPETMANLTRAGRLAATEGAWVFLPEGLNQDWNSDPSKVGGADDVGFLGKLIDVAITQRQLDGRHLYFAGYSGGGFMSERMACEAGDRIAGIGIVAATLRSAQAPRCAPTHTVPVIEMNGTSDAVVFYNGLFANYQGYYGAPATAAFWALKNGCDPNAVQTTTLPNQEVIASNTVVQQSTFTGCPAGTAVRLDTIDNGGHTWPGSKDANYTAALGRTSGDVDATTAIWQFLIAFPLS